MMNKKFFPFIIALFACIVSAEAAPKLLKIQGGNVKINLNRDRDYILIDAYWKNRPMMTGSAGQMLAYSEPGAGFVGAGRKTKDFQEKMESLTVKIDGKPVDWNAADAFSGQVAEVERVSAIRDIKVVYAIRLEGDRMTESVNYTADKEVTLQCLYHLHLWNKRFAEYRTVNHKDVVSTGKLTQSKKVLYHGYSVIFAFADAEGEDAAVVRYQRSDKVPPTCYIQDKWNGAEDALIACFRQKLAAGVTYNFQSEINFFKTGSAESAMEKVKNAAQ